MARYKEQVPNTGIFRKHPGKQLGNFLGLRLLTEAQEAMRIECYHLVPRQWDIQYSIGANIGRRDVLSPAPYAEHLTLEVEADLIHPKIKQTGMLKLTFLARRELESLVTSRDLSTPTPLCIGKVTLRGGRREFLSALPKDMLLRVLNRSKRPRSPLRRLL